MYFLLLTLTVLLVVGCGCPDRPDSYKGAKLTGCPSGGTIACCSYSGKRCSYTLCQVECGDWNESSWHCY